MTYDPLDPATQANPFPAYAALRREAPVAWLPAIQAWAISRYADVDWAIRNPQVFSSAEWITQSLGDLKPVAEVPWMIEMDPPAHSRVRKLVSKAFTPRMVAQLEPRVRTLARELLSEIRGHGEVDFVRAFSGVYPVIVIAEMLGVEPERRADFRRWSDNIVAATNRPSDEAQRAAIRASNTAMLDYLDAAIADRRRHPREDLLTALVRAEEEAQTLSAREVLAMAVLILVAGNETTMNLMGNTLVNLHPRPELTARVRRDPRLIPQLLEEVLRYDSPVQIVFRRTTQPVEMAGAAMPADAAVLVLLGSANRDPEKFPDADRFDPTRDASEHLAFGFGTHYCLGAQLARLEARIAFEEIFAMAPSFTVDPSRSERVGSILLRGVRNLPFSFD
ncbi:MAG TPA: cytochrome P450 [Candidatus Binataceae bacterium]|nr:cytochrome P450 [Candidatus Binataceae bacterium]